MHALVGGMKNTLMYENCNKLVLTKLK